MKPTFLQPSRRRPSLLVFAVLAGVASVALAQSWKQGIYTCVDAAGKRHTSDRPILECLDREQRVLNSDGSTRHLIGPSMTAEERARAEAREKQRQSEREKQLEAGRRDRVLLARYPSESAHQKAREAALEDVRSAIRKSEQRIAELGKERQPLLAESEFYRGKALPTKLQQALEFNDVAVEAHKSLIENRQTELLRINAQFDRELERLRAMWSGVAPGRIDSPTLSAQDTNQRR